MIHKCRAAIDGWRAVSVLSVLLYHFGVSAICGCSRQPFSAKWQHFCPNTGRIFLIAPTAGAPHETPCRLAVFNLQKWGKHPAPVSRSLFDREAQWFDDAIKPLLRNKKWFQSIHRLGSAPQTHALMKAM